MNPADVPLSAQQLIGGLSSRPGGRVSPSVYETARLVSSAPWLVGHSKRVEHLLSMQRLDGAWGAPDGYALVPTLSAAEAILMLLRREHESVWHPGQAPVDRTALATAAHRALRFLVGQLNRHTPLPDLPASHLIVPGLVESINGHLDWLVCSSVVGLDAWRAAAPLPLPRGMDMDGVHRIRADLEAGRGVPDKALHALEVAGSAARRARGIRPVPPGTVGASPAATVAWLGEPDQSRAARAVMRYLVQVIQDHDGLAPCGIPITEFERSWVLAELARAGIDVDVAPDLLDGLDLALGEKGTPGGAGLPPDADTTAVALFALAHHGRPRRPSSLWSYRSPTHFRTWPEETNPSTSTNAHVLEALGSWMGGRTSGLKKYAKAAQRLSAWLCQQQGADGSWIDRWHASPYYAVASCGLALYRFGGQDSRSAVRKAVTWILSTQRRDGSWGRWRGTAEETAYAVQVLLITRMGPITRIIEAAADGYRYLVRSARQGDRPSLWHDKDLYLPVAIVDASILAALRFAQRSPAVMMRVARSQPMQRRPPLRPRAIANKLTHCN